jgi:hypothetical protein
MTDYPITPPPVLVQQWVGLLPQGSMKAFTAAAQWGSDQELEACCEWFVQDWTDIETADKLRAARRPKPPSLKEQALKDLDDLEVNLKDFGMGFVPITNLRKALEALPND